MIDLLQIDTLATSQLTELVKTAAGWIIGVVTTLSAAVGIVFTILIKSNKQQRDDLVAQSNAHTADLKTALQRQSDSAIAVAVSNEKIANAIDNQNNALENNTRVLENNTRVLESVITKLNK